MNDPKHVWWYETALDANYMEGLRRLYERPPFGKHGVV